MPFGVLFSEEIKVSLARYMMAGRGRREGGEREERGRRERGEREERGRREGGKREERGESVRELRRTILQGGWSHLFTWVFSCTSGTHMGGEASNLPCFLAAPGNSLRDVSEADPSVSRESWKMRGGTEAE